jgi:hypothetical protein
MTTKFFKKLQIIIIDSSMKLKINSNLTKETITKIRNQTKEDQSWNIIKGYLWNFQ